MSFQAAPHQNTAALLAGVFGAAIFLLIYEWQILNPANIQWLLLSDPAQHFLGWHFYRNEAWTFPPGKIHHYLFPQGTSLVYTDAIPLIAMPLKLIADVLPPIFQYLGLWLLICYVLQGYLAACLIQKLHPTAGVTVILMASLFFILSPVMVQRAAGHESLVAHWLILWGLILYFSDTYRQRGWILLLGFSVLTHFYLFFMAGAIFIAALIKQWLMRHHLKTIVMNLLTAVLATLFIMWIAGYFIFEIQHNAKDGLGYYSMNIMAPFNPGQMKENIDTPTLFLRPVKFYASGQYEGLNYMGAGVLALLTLVITILISSKNKLFNKTTFPLLMLSLVLTILAISPMISFGEVKFWEIQIPGWLEKLLLIVRSSGRLFWPVNYILLLGIIILCLKVFRENTATLILAIALVLQIADFYPWYSNVKLLDRSHIKPSDEKAWAELVKPVRHIVVIPPRENGDQYIKLALIAAKYNKTLNIGYVARSNQTQREQYAQRLLQTFEAGRLDKSSLYLIPQEAHKLRPKKKPQGFKSGYLDSYYYMTPGLTNP